MFPLKGTSSSEVTLTGITTSSPGYEVILPTVTSVGILGITVIIPVPSEGKYLPSPSKLPFTGYSPE